MNQSTKDFVNRFHSMERRLKVIERRSGRPGGASDLDASVITSGTLNVARIPNLDAGKITSGSFHIDRIPKTFTSTLTISSSTYRDHLELQRDDQKVEQTLSTATTLGLNPSVDGLRFLDRNGAMMALIADNGIASAGDVIVPDGPLTGGIKLADVTLTSAGEFNITGLPNYPFYKVLVHAGDTSSDSIGGNNLGLRLNNASTADGYRWNFTDLGVSLGVMDTANYVPVARTSRGDNRTFAEITITNTGSWPLIMSRGFGNWGTTGSRHTLTGAVRAATITVNSIQLFVHTANDIAAGARAIVYGYG